MMPPKQGPLNKRRTRSVKESKKVTDVKSKRKRLKYSERTAPKDVGTPKKTLRSGRKGKVILDKQKDEKSNHKKSVTKSPEIPSVGSKRKSKEGSHLHSNKAAGINSGLKNDQNKISPLKNNESKEYVHKCKHCSRTFETLRGQRRHQLFCQPTTGEAKAEYSEVDANLERGSTDSSDNTKTNGSVMRSSVARNEGGGNVISAEAQQTNSPPSVGLSGSSEKPKYFNTCEYCPRSFNTLTGLRRHTLFCKSKPSDSNTRSIGDGDKVKPEGSSDINNSSNDAENGLCQCCGESSVLNHSIGEHHCPVCGAMFLLQSSLERHQKRVHQYESHECPQCGAKCPDKGTLARHMYTHTGLKPYFCPVCKQEFSRKYHLVRHNMQTGCDGKEKPIFPCQVCGREFNRKDNLREHLRAHAGQTKCKKMYACDSCGMEFRGTNLLQVHKRSHTGEKPYCCEFCPKRFTSSGAMKKHRRTHTGEKPYECATCQKRFAAKETLNRHVRIHTGYKPHCCPYCGKRFIQSSQLRSHLHFHTGPTVVTPTETFHCDFCGKQFNRRARLNEHTKYIHLGAKPFECSQCPKTFIRKEDLNRHLIIHSGVKAHKCPICTKAFAMKSSLKVHLLTHTKEPPRSCDECGRAFIRQDCLLRHMRSKHRDMLEEIMSQAEKKKLQQQLLQVAAEASLADGLVVKGEMDENALSDAVKELLTLLVDETTLRGLGWPDVGVEHLLEAVIRRCGHEPAPSSGPSLERLRHNVKLLFTVVIDDSAVKALLNNQTVDEVILHVLRLAKS